MDDDRFEVSLRFRLTVEAKIRQLEEDAIFDAKAMADLECEDHRRRQRMLVQAQLERARTLRELLIATRVRPQTAA
jgi:hypothetical protein